MGQVLICGARPDVVYKDPDEIRDFPVDWRPDLPAGVTIAATLFTPADPALVVDASTFSDEGTVVRLSGGTAGTRVPVTNRVTLSNAEVYEYTFTVVVRNR